MEIPARLSRTHLGLLVLSFVSVLLASPSIASASADHPTEAPPAMVRLPGHVLPALSKATALSPAGHAAASDANQPFTITIVLNRDDQPAFERYLRELYDPHSKNFHRFLSQSEIAKRFGPSRRAYNSVLGYLRANGFRLTEGSKNRLTLTARGTRAEAERAFGVRIRDYTIGERQFYANDSDPRLPLAVASRVQAVSGLSDYAKPRPTHIAIFSAFCAVEIGLLANIVGLDPNTINGKSCILGMLAQCINSNATAAGYGVQISAQFPPCNLLGLSEPAGEPAAAYGTADSAAAPAASPWQSANGAGQTIGLAEFDNFQSSDVSDYLSLVGLPAAAIGNLSEVNVDGGTSIGAGEDEVLLDIDTVMTIAPGAKVAVYDAPFTGSGASFQRVFNQMINDGVSVISNSWAYCEDETTSADVSSIDSIFQNGAASSISVFNGAGDSGSSCLDGSANTVAVPADSPNATAVGGSSLAPGPSYAYGVETWWDDSKTSPPAGQGGFGTSKFFAAPGYQSGLGSANRSVPDVVSNADPFHGVEICQADDGGCPSGKQYGGTSMAAPAWAAYTALLNQSLGHNLGFLNPEIYPLAATAAFHDAASLTSDFAHVGLGSPNLAELHQMLASETVGAVDASVSEVLAFLKNGFQAAGAPAPSGEPADGASQSFVAVNLYDSNGNVVSGKTVTLTANPGNHATIVPPSAVTGINNGAAAFTVTDATPETLTLTAMDTTDGITLKAAPTLPFVSPVATQAGLNAFPTTVTADGATPTDITVTLKDSLGRPSPGKLVQINQTGGSSAVSGPIPPVTDASGTIEFTAVDSNNETITYSAVDVTDGNIPFPETGTVTFSSAPEAGCSNTQVAAPGFVATPYATGFEAQNFFFSSINFGGCPGAWGMAFDSGENLYVSDLPTGNLYKFPPGGGVANGGTLLATIGETLAGLAFDNSGKLYGSRFATGGAFTTGVVMQINPSTGAVIGTVASNLTCPGALSPDPLSGDLFTDDVCSGGGGDNPALWRISGPGTGSPTTTVYTNLPNTPNANIAFAPSGDMYIWDSGQGAMVTGTSGPNPPVVTVVPTIGDANLGMQAYGTQFNGDAQFLIANFPPNTSITPNSPPTVNVFDLTTTPPTVSTPIIANGGGNGMITGPDGCIYIAQGVAVWKITDTSGACNYTAHNPPPTLALTPATFSSNAEQGSPVTLTASFHNATAPAGTPVTFQVMGANPQLATVGSAAAGTAAFTYIAVKQGVDTITASAPLGTASLNSNPAVVTWGPGTDVTFLTLNASPTSAAESQIVTVTANLTDVSASPPAALAGRSVNFTIGGNGCGATTDSNGNAACQITPSGSGLMTLAANFPGTSQFNPSTDSKGFVVVAPAPTATVTATPTATATATATPTATPTPVVGKLKVSPKALNFGTVELGADKIKSVKITNAGKVTKKKHPLPILIEMESGVTSPFTLTLACTDDDLGPKAKGVPPGSCEVSVKFMPTAAVKYSGTMRIEDNLEPGFGQNVKLKGAGKAPKK